MRRDLKGDPHFFCGMARSQAPGGKTPRKEEGLLAGRAGFLGWLSRRAGFTCSVSSQVRQRGVSHCWVGSADVEAAGGVSCSEGPEVPAGNTRGHRVGRKSSHPRCPTARLQHSYFQIWGRSSAWDGSSQGDHEARAQPVLFAHLFRLRVRKHSVGECRGLGDTS